MYNASVERLAKIISDPRSNGEHKGLRPRKPTFRIHIGLEEGWFSLFLLATVIYSTVWCVQAAGWVNNLGILSLTTLFGLIAGVIAAKQQRFPRVLVHLVATGLGILIALWQTAGADYHGSVSALINGMHQWLLISIGGGVGTDDSIFLFFITALGFILAYTSAWLVYRTRAPWLMVVANAVVLLINLSNIEAGYIVFLVVFLIASLLLLLRFNLYESMMRWRRQGMRCADDLGWDVMQAGALISIGILIFSWLLPWGYTNDQAAQVWNSDSNPWVQLQNLWNRVFYVTGGSSPSNRGNFTNTLVLAGNPNLNNDVVFTVKTSDNAPQYLESLSYDTYTGRSWASSPTSSTPLNPNDSVYNDFTAQRAIQQEITVVNPPGEQYSYLLGAPQIVSVDQSAVVQTSTTDGSVVTWLRKAGKLAAGDHYTVLSYVSAADIKTLRSVPLPADSPQLPANFDGPIPVTYYDPAILSSYLQFPKSLDHAILRLAQRITADAPTMYDKAIALESYLRINYAYDVHIQLPSDEEGVSWFLFRSGNRGFCNYFATAMTIMARELGIPARVVAGYTHGVYDTAHHRWVIHGTDAHSWTQIYFAGYGWVNFEPSAGFPTFSRPLPGSSTTGTITPGGGGSTGTTKPVNNRNKLLDNADAGGAQSTQTQTSWGQPAGLALGSVILLILFGLIFFSLWWRRLFRGYKLSKQIYGRISLLANWAGIPIERSQTPYESIHTLSTVTPEQTVTLERFGDIYVRELWADPTSSEHPDRTGEARELPGLWKRLQPALFLYVLRHPYFLRSLAARLGRFLRSRRRRVSTARPNEGEVKVEEVEESV